MSRQHSIFTICINLLVLPRKQTYVFPLTPMPVLLCFVEPLIKLECILITKVMKSSDYFFVNCKARLLSYYFFFHFCTKLKKNVVM